MTRCGTLSKALAVIEPIAACAQASSNTFTSRLPELNISATGDPSGVTRPPTSTSRVVIRAGPRTAKVYRRNSSIAAWEEAPGPRPCDAAAPDAQPARSPSSRARAIISSRNIPRNSSSGVARPPISAVSTPRAHHPEAGHGAPRAAYRSSATSPGDMPSTPGISPPKAVSDVAVPRPL